MSSQKLESIRQDRRKTQDPSYLEDNIEKRGQLFSIVLVQSPLLEKIFYELRYVVYIKEKRIHFEESNIFNHLEKDRLDERSMKFLLFYKPLHLFLGGVRIILPDPEKDGADLPTLEKSSILKTLFPEEVWAHVGEVSRFIISKERVRLCINHARTLNQFKCLEDFEAQKLQALLSGCYFACKAHKLSNLIFALEKPLIKIAQKNHLIIDEMPEVIHSHGDVITAVIDINKNYDNLRDINPKLLEIYAANPERG